MRRSWTPSIVPNGHDQTFYLVMNNYETLGRAFAETDVGEADLITDLMSSEYSDPVRVVAFNTTEHWSEDASEDVAREIMRRLDLAGGALPSSLAAFVEPRRSGPSTDIAARLSRCPILGQSHQPVASRPTIPASLNRRWQRQSTRSR
jgi:hypothetical protein